MYGFPEIENKFSFSNCEIYLSSREISSDSDFEDWKRNFLLSESSDQHAIGQFANLPNLSDSIYSAWGNIIKQSNYSAWGNIIRFELLCLG